MEKFPPALTRRFIFLGNGTSQQTAVFRVTDRSTGKDCYLKTIKRGGTTLFNTPQALAKEYAATELAYKRHPTGTVQPLEYCDPRPNSDHPPYLLTQEVPGDLLPYALEKDMWTLPLIISLIEQAGRQVYEWSKEHRKLPKLFHADYADKNILLTPKRKLVAIDFGLSYTDLPDIADQSSSIRLMLSSVMTPGYYPAERIAECPERGHIYNPLWCETFALAVLCYQLITGLHPFKAATKTRYTNEVISNLEKPPEGITKEALKKRVRAGSLDRIHFDQLDALFSTALAFRSDQRGNFNTPKPFIQALLAVLNGRR